MPADVHRLDTEGALEWLQQALRDGKIAPLPNGVSNNTQRQLLALTTWKRGCEAAAQDNYKAARKLFDEAAHEAPGAPLYEVSAILTAAVLQDFTEADERWSRARDRWRNDIRSGIILALLGLAHKNFDDAEAWMREPASNLVRATSEAIAGQYYYVLVWKGRYTEARDYAGQMVAFLKRQNAPASIWLERTGDALFFEQDYRQAGQFYEQALQADPKNTVTYLKLSDVWFQLGDREKERFYREGVYGALK
jgi:tetratricopeptide (TPR) repeat protein